MEVEINGVNMLIVNLYAPNSDEPMFFQKIIQEIESSESNIKLIGGDFNILLDPHIDRKAQGSKPKQTKSVQIVNSFLDQNEWVDIWRVLPSRFASVTWMRRAPLTMSRLDYFLIPQETISIVNECNILPGLLSDHSFVNRSISMESQLKGPGYWKLNTSLLTNKAYVNEMNSIIDRNFNKHKHKTRSYNWELLKIEATEYSQYFSKKLANEKSVKRKRSCRNYVLKKKG